ncbi:hypothetical protein CVT24_013323 [Panaeolus cyanescens]|uniref:F-box domain-containing protein n=1 Tax=Panaeolus cyanescens TaxID=181874 RepID=A0A409YME1_9AGAR|nr:hypothetical protein CVT24_013323 [Panaeolus cyanescens]
MLVVTPLGKSVSPQTPTSIPSNAIRLPTELLKKIIDALAASMSQCPDLLRSTMKKVALTSTQILPLARPHLFHTLELGGKHDPEGVRRTSLARLLVEQPYLQNSVNQIIYVLHKEETHLDIASDVAPLLHLPKVRTLSISWAYRPRHEWHKSEDEAQPPDVTFGWRSLLHHYTASDSLKSLFMQHVSLLRGSFMPDILSSPTLVSVTFRDCFFCLDGSSQEWLKFTKSRTFNVIEEVECTSKKHYAEIPLVFLASCPKLKKFKGEYMTHQGRGVRDFPPALGRPFLNLHRLELASPGSMYAWEIVSDDLSGICGGEAVFPVLKELVLGITHIRQSIKPLFDLMPSLEYLKAYGAPRADFNFMECLQQFGHLNTMELLWPFPDIALSEDDETTDPTLERALSYLEDLQLTSVEHISLTIGISKDWRYDKFQDLDVYEALGRVMDNYRGIIGTSAFPSLKTLEITVVQKIADKHWGDGFAYIEAAKAAWNEHLKAFVTDQDFSYFYHARVYPFDYATSSWDSPVQL